VTLQAGRTLGQYEILSTLGAGGMGEVYRARDARLGREVAIKLLLDEVSGDPERLSRFEREAPQLHLVQNFFAVLERLVPTD
jgi:serine/threonine protein kinase